MKKTERYFSKQNDKEDNAEVQIFNVTLKSKPRKRPPGNYKTGTHPNKIVKKKYKQQQNPNPKFKGRVPIAEETLKKYVRGDGVNVKAVKTTYRQKKIENKEKKIKFSTEQSARAEVLLTEDTGYLEADDGETTTQYTQRELLENVDITAASKCFELKLTDFGPYRAKYTRNGRHLLLSGKMGHVAAFDWVTKKLHCETNVMESVCDISWLHNETMFAVAQKDWVYIYDCNQGTELHCIKRLNRVSRMEFLPYHFLLATCSEEGYLSWLDVSLGQMVTQYNTKLGRLTMLTQNPSNAVLCLGHAKGVVSMWSPNSRDPLVKMLCHKAPMTSLHVDPKGVYMATSAINREVKIWDIRSLNGPLQQYKLPRAADSVQFSQKNMLALGMGNVVEVYRDCCAQAAKRAYMRHVFNCNIGNMSFCPYEDVLGVATAKGFASLLIPGAGEANFDALESNPFQTRSQRQETEVKGLLEKIQPEMITLDPLTISEVDTKTLLDKLEQKKKLLFIKPPKINYTPKNKAKGKGGSVKIARNKKIVQEQAKKEFIKSAKHMDKKDKLVAEVPKRALDRFKSKK